MGQGFHETAHNHVDLKKFKENYVAVFGEKPKEFCDDCGFRFSYCECSLDKIKPCDCFDVYSARECSCGINKKEKEE